jgi:hypothetical protein
MMMTRVDVAARYREIIRRSVPALTEAEWMACADALNGVWLGDPVTGPPTLWMEIADADQLDGLGAKWGIDAQALAQRLRDAHYAAAMAVIDVVERPWGSLSLTAARVGHPPGRAKP